MSTLERITFEREDGTTYVAELPGDQQIELVDGELVAADQLVIGDEIVSHTTHETGRGHRVIR